MRGPDGRIGVWSFDTKNFQPIPALDPKYAVAGWTPDGSSVYVAGNQLGLKSAKLYKVNTTTGKMDFWREFGQGLSGGISSVGLPHFSSDGNAYVYVYVRTLSQAYVAKGLK